MLIKDAVEMYLRSMDSNDMSPLTISAYRYVFNNFMTFLEKKKIFNIEDIDHVLLDNYVLAIKNEKLKSDDNEAEENTDVKEKKTKESHKRTVSTMNKAKCALRSLFKYLKKNKYLTENPSLDLKVRKISRKLPVWLEPEQFDALLKRLNNDEYGLVYKTIFVLMAKTGLRISELLSLTIEDVADRDSVTVKGKGEKNRSIPMNALVKDVLKVYLGWRASLKTETNALFLSKMGNTYIPMAHDAINRAIKQLSEGIMPPGKTITPHKLRHSFATWLRQQKVDLELIRKLMGHESIETTSIYTHVDNQEEVDAVEKI